MAIPKFKKKINEFIEEESGHISKETLIKAGIMAVIAASLVENVYACRPGTNTNKNSYWRSVGEPEINAEFNPETNTFIGTHSQHNDHCSHSSHGSHGSHGSGGWW